MPTFGQYKQDKTNTKNYLERLFILGPQDVHTVLETWLDWQWNGEAPNMAWMQQRLLGRFLGPPTSTSIWSILCQCAWLPSPPNQHTHTHTHTVSTWMHAHRQDKQNSKIKLIFHIYWRALVYADFFGPVAEFSGIYKGNESKNERGKKL